MMRQKICSALTAAWLVGTAACDGLWQPQCTADLGTSCVPTTITATLTQQPCGQQLTLDLRVFSDKEDVTMRFMNAASQMTVELSDSTPPLGPLIAVNGVLRATFLRDADQRATVKRTVSLKWDNQSVSTPVDYPSSARKFVLAAVQKLNGSGDSSQLFKYGGIHPDPDDSTPSPRSLLAMASVDGTQKSSQYDFYSVANKILVPKGSHKAFSNNINFSGGNLFRVTNSGYTFYLQAINLITTPGITFYDNVSTDGFRRPLLAVTGTSDLVATVYAERPASPKLTVHTDLRNMISPWSVLLAGDVRGLALGDLENLGTQEVLVVMKDGTAQLFGSLNPNVKLAKLEREKVLTARLKPLEQSGNTIGAVALADFDQNGQTDILVQQHLKNSASQSQLGIIYGGLMNPYDEWQTFSPLEDQKLGGESILQQEIQTIEAGLIDGDDCPDLVISTKNDIRIYLGSAP